MQAVSIHSMNELDLVDIDGPLVFSFFGVILIARPPFLFGGALEKPSEVVPSGKRMVSVMLGGSFHLADVGSHLVS